MTCIHCPVKMFYSMRTLTHLTYAVTIWSLCCAVYYVISRNTLSPLTVSIYNSQFLTPGSVKDFSHQQIEDLSSKQQHNSQLKGNDWTTGPREIIITKRGLGAAHETSSNALGQHQHYYVFPIRPVALISTSPSFPASEPASWQPAKNASSQQTPADLTLLVLVCSKPSNFHARLAIRKTWLSHSHPIQGVTVKRVFVVGSVTNATLQEILHNEGQIWGDLLQASFHDSYLNLTLKTLAALEWTIKYGPDADYVVKADDDAFINIQNVAKHLVENRPKRTILGYKCSNVPPERNPKSKWHVTKNMYPNNTYPDFAAGWAYIISADSLIDLHNTAHKTNFLYLEDIFLTGICRAKSGVMIKSHKGFRARINPANHREVREFFAVHFVTVKDHLAIWTAQKLINGQKN